MARASLLLGLWLAVAAVAASPQLHERLHPDSQALNHHCLFAQLSKGSLLDGLPASVVLPAPSLAACSPSVVEVHFSFSIDRRLSPTRGPPFISASFPVVG